MSDVQWTNTVRFEGSYMTELLWRDGLPVAVLASETDKGPWAANALTVGGLWTARSDFLSRTQALDWCLEVTATPTTPALNRARLGIMTPPELADALEVTEGGLHEWRKKGTGPAFTRRGKRIYYLVDDVKVWLKERAP